MVDNATNHFIRSYEQVASPTYFLSGFFQAPEINYFESEKVTYDIRRTESDVAVAVKNLSDPGRTVSSDIFTNKEVAPIIYSENFAMDASVLHKRDFNDNPFEKKEDRVRAAGEFIRQMSLLEDRFQRAMELQASQLLQGGTVAPIDQDGNAVYSIDFSMKSTHKVSVGSAWTGTSDKLTDIDNLAQVIRQDARMRPDTLIFGRSAWDNFIKDDTVQKFLDVRRYELGSIGKPSRNAEGATYHGSLTVGTQVFDLWCYDETYKAVDTGTETPYLTDDYVLMLCTKGMRLDATFGNIPDYRQIFNTESTDILSQIGLPRRMKSSARAMDLHLGAEITNKGRVLEGGAAMRGILIPTSIDAFGYLDTE